MTKPPSPLEREEQKTLVQYLETKHYKFSALPLSTYTTSWKQKATNKAMGVRAGVPDLMVIVPRPKEDLLLFIEMKRRDATMSAITSEQMDWLTALNCCEGVAATLCAGADEAIKFIKQVAKDDI